MRLLLYQSLQFRTWIHIIGRRLSHLAIVIHSMSHQQFCNLNLVFESSSSGMYSIKFGSKENSDFPTISPLKSSLQHHCYPVRLRATFGTYQYVVHKINNYRPSFLDTHDTFLKAIGPSFLKCEVKSSCNVRAASSNLCKLLCNWQTWIRGSLLLTVLQESRRVVSTVIQRLKKNSVHQGVSSTSPFA